MRINALTSGASVIALAMTATTVQAQQAVTPAVTNTVGAPDDSEPTANEIVVTGTQIRGIAPVGANVIGISDAQIQATGATSTGDVLATLPQAVNFFNASPFAGGGVLGGNAP